MTMIELPGTCMMEEACECLAVAHTTIEGMRVSTEEILAVWTGNPERPPLAVYIAVIGAALIKRAAGSSALRICGLAIECEKMVKT